MYHDRSDCRACGSERLAHVLDLGETALANDFLDCSKTDGYDRNAPLNLMVCEDCGFVQLREVVDPVVMYSNYAYVTSTSQTMDAHMAELAAHLVGVAGGDSPPRVMEIASNTGLLLKKFMEQGCEVLGVEPAANISKIAVEDEGVPTLTQFFGAETGAGIAADWGKADIVLGRHVFAHIDDLQGLLVGLDAVTHDDSVVSFEVPYVVDFFENTEFDTIYHEHLSYVALTGIQALVADSPFHLFRVDRYPIHGGSIVFSLTKRAGSRAVEASVAEMLALEESLKLRDPATWSGFADRVNAIRRDLPALVRSLRAEGKRVIGYGASAKGNTLLNTSGITTADFDYIIDNTPFKQGQCAPGTWLPVRKPESLLEDQPDYAVLLAWNFAAEIIAREQEYQRRGGRFIVPIPHPRVVDFPDTPA